MQYIQFVNIIKNFVRAERQGNWTHHLAAKSKMLNPYAATGHINYAKNGDCIYKWWSTWNMTIDDYMQSFQSMDITLFGKRANHGHVFRQNLYLDKP